MNNIFENVNSIKIEVNPKIQLFSILMIFLFTLMIQDCSEKWKLLKKMI